ncbi:helix-hairpin-helix domain-containing protein [soil metagenome]
MTRADVARVLAEIATLSELNGENPFRSRAFAGAARSLEGSDVDLEALSREGTLTSLSGVGPAIAETIRELVETGRSALYEELKTATPIGLYDLLRIPGLGAKRIHTLHGELGIDSLDALEEAARAGRIANLSGFGARTEKKILAGLAFVRTSRGRRRYPEALEVAVRLLLWLRERPGIRHAEIAGALRRRLEIVETVELVAGAEETSTLVEAFVQLNGVTQVVERGGGEHALVELTDGLRARLRCVPPERFTGALLWQTGSDAHLRELVEGAAAAGLRLDSDGLWQGDQLVQLADESSLYARLGLAYIPPELREGMGEVALAYAGPLPRLVELDDLRGTFHCHTTYSDGKATVAEMAEAARERGWFYLGLADHSRAAAYAGGLSIERVREQQREIDAWNQANAASGFRIFKGTESDILPDGSLDYPDEVLASFDYVVGSVHSGFGISREEMTERVLRAVRNPYLTILGHPTGRLLLTREGYPLDVEAVLDAAAEHGVVVEINANPHRLDLDWRHLRYAAERGVLIAINPDAHSVDGLEHVVFGVNIARKGGLEARQVLNTWALEEVGRYFEERRERR